MARVTAKLTSGMVAQISNGRHEWTADEPVAAGGTDSGPDPYELLLGALAACTCATISGYCRYKELPLESITATFDFARIHADDCAVCDDADEGMIDHVTSNVHIEGDFSDSVKKRLAQIATRCPVHKTLTKGIRFDDHATFGRASNAS